MYVKTKKVSIRLELSILFAGPIQLVRNSGNINVNQQIKSFSSCQKKKKNCSDEFTAIMAKNVSVTVILPIGLPFSKFSFHAYNHFDQLILCHVCFLVTKHSASPLTASEHCSVYVVHVLSTSKEHKLKYCKTDSTQL